MNRVETSSNARWSSVASVSKPSSCARHVSAVRRGRPPDRRPPTRPPRRPSSPTDHRDDGSSVPVAARRRTSRIAPPAAGDSSTGRSCGTLPSTTADWRRVSSFTDDVAERRAARAAALPLIPTTVIGSFPQPAWLVDHDLLVAKGVPRTRADDVWRIPPDELDEALDAATLLAIHDQVTAGIDIVTDGEIRRESYFNHFANALDGVARDRLGAGVNRVGGRSDVPLVEGPIRRGAPVELGPATFLRARHRPVDQGHRARAVHAQPAGSERALPGPADAGVGLRRGDQRGAGRPRRRGHRRGAARRAVPAGQRRRRPAVRRRGHRPGARRDRRDHGAAHLLRLRRVRRRQVGWLPVPRRARRLRGRPDRRRVRPAAARSGCARAARRQDDRARRARSLDERGRADRV